MSLSPSRKSALLAELDGREGARAPSPAPGPRDFGVPGPSAPIPAGSAARGRRSAGTGRAGAQGARRTPNMGAGPAERPIGPPAAPSPNRHSGSSASCPRILIKVLCRSAHFQPISREGACRYWRCVESSLPCLRAAPGALARRPALPGWRF